MMINTRPTDTIVDMPRTPKHGAIESSQATQTSQCISTHSSVSPVVHSEEQCLDSRKLLGQSALQNELFQALRLGGLTENAASSLLTKRAKRIDRSNRIKREGTAASRGSGTDARGSAKGLLKRWSDDDDQLEQPTEVDSVEKAFGKTLRKMLQEWIGRTAKLDGYVSELLENGYDTHEMLTELDETSLAALGMLKPHAKKVMKHIRRLDPDLPSDEKIHLRVDESILTNLGSPRAHKLPLRDLSLLLQGR